MDNIKLDPKELFGEDGIQFMPTDEIKGMLSYLQSLDWNEPWLYCLISLHLLLFLAVFLTRRFTSIQSGIFLMLLIFVYEAENLNEYLSKNHKLFTKHQYFDSPGLFISIIMSFPFLLLCSIIVANWFFVSTQLMKELKVQQVERSRRREEKAKEKKCEEKTNSEENPIDSEDKTDAKMEEKPDKKND